MPVSASTVKLMGRAAFFTSVLNHAVRAGSAFHDGLHDLFVDWRHAITVAGQIRRTRILEDLLNGAHDNTPCIIRETRSFESVCAWVVTWR